MAARGWPAGCALLLLFGVAPQLARADSCPLFVLKRAGDDVVIERQQIDAGSTKVFIADADTGIIDVIVPPGTGGSADLVQWSKPQTIVVRFTENMVRVTTQSDGGKEHTRLPQWVKLLRNRDIRVNVSFDRGRRKAFIIEEYDTVCEDDVAPVVDLFGGNMPLGEGDFAVTTQTTTRIDPAAMRTGEFAFEFLHVGVGGYLLTTVQIRGGATATFVVDSAAGLSVITRRVLPEDVAIQESVMRDYSTAGTRRLKYAIGGATGDRTDAAGLATLPMLTVGDMPFDNTVVLVMESLFELGGRRIDGIIGMDILRRAPVVTVEYPRPGESAGRVFFSRHPQTPNDSGCVYLPQASVGKLAFVRGSAGGEPVWLVLDTGASCNFMSPESANALGVPIDRNKTRTVRTLDGLSVDVTAATLPALELGGRPFNNVPIEVGPQTVLGRFQTGQSVGILGNAFLQQFRRVEFDFGAQQVRLID